MKKKGKSSFEKHVEMWKKKYQDLKKDKKVERFREFH